MEFLEKRAAAEAGSAKASQELTEIKRAAGQLKKPVEPSKVQCAFGWIDKRNQQLVAKFSEWVSFDGVQNTHNGETLSYSKIGLFPTFSRFVFRMETAVPSQLLIFRVSCPLTLSVSSLCQSFYLGLQGGSACSVGYEIS